MKTAITELFQLGAIVSETEPLELTDDGNLMARIPLDPPLAKVLVNAKNYGVVEPVMTILSILSSESLLATTEGKRQGLKKRFCAPEGDLVSYLKVYREYKKTATKSSWCKMNGLNLRYLLICSRYDLGCNVCNAVIYFSMNVSVLCNMLPKSDPIYAQFARKKS